MDDDIPFPMGSLTDDQTDAAEEYQIPLEELIPNSVRHGLDPQTLSKPLDPAVYGYDINQMRERPWAKPGADKSDYFNYGFEEESWRAYCALQAQGIQSLRARADKFIAEILSTNGAAQSSASPVGGFQSTYGAQAADRSKFYKTQLCNSYLAGSCPKGLSCNFAHGQAELRQFVYSGDRPMAPAAAPMPPAVPIPTGLPPLASMPPLMPTLMPPQMPRPTGEGVLSAPAMPYVPMQTPIMSAPVMPPQPQPLSVAALPKGPAGFRMVPAQKRDRSPDNMTY